MAKNSKPIFTAKHYEKIAEILGAATKYDLFAVDVFVQVLEIDNERFDASRFRKTIKAVASGPDICPCGSTDFDVEFTQPGIVKMCCKKCGRVCASEGDN